MKPLPPPYSPRTMRVLVTHMPSPRFTPTTTVYNQVTDIYITIDPENASNNHGTLCITGGEAGITAEYAAEEWISFSVGKY